jgi:hypothetical protein
MSSAMTYLKPACSFATLFIEVKIDCEHTAGHHQPRDQHQRADNRAGSSPADITLSCGIVLLMQPSAPDRRSAS